MRGSIWRSFILTRPGIVGGGEQKAREQAQVDCDLESRP